MSGLGIKSILPCLLLTVAAATAEGPSFWTDSARSDFLKGETEGVAILEDETIVLSHRLENIVSLGAPVVWSLASDSRGRVYLGTGHDGRLYRLDKNGDTTLVRAFDRPEVTAVAVDSRDNLFAATSPDGELFRVRDNGEIESWFNPPEKYIWALLPGPSGEIYAATGPKGKVYQISGKGQAKEILTSDDQHIISLALDKEGNLLAGSSGMALIYQVNPAGEVSIIYDSQMKDIRSIVVDDENNLYVGAFTLQIPGERPSPLLGPRETTLPQTDEQKEGESGQEEGRQPGQPIVIRVPAVQIGESASSEIYFFDRDRFPTRIWQGSGETVMAIGLSARGRALFVSTKDKSSLYSVDQTGDLALLGTFPDDQATVFHRDRTNGRMLIATSNMGKVIELEDRYRSEGRFRSQVYNAGLPAEWGAITFKGDLPSGANLHFRTRSGNTVSPDTTWSAWSSPYRPGGSARIESPPRMYFQWEVVLTASRQDASPRIREVTVSYLRRNRAPMISQIRFLPLGVYIRSAEPAVVPSEQSSSEIPTDVEQLLNPRKPSSTTNPFTGKREFVKGMRMAGWNASDANGDELRYNVYFRGLEESNWRPLALSLSRNSFAWNTQSMADGWYVLKVAAHDSLDNPGDRARLTERESGLFLVDNTPPEPRDVRLEKKGADRALLTFEAVDSAGRIGKAQVSLDGEPWRPLFPEDGIADTPRENYRIEMEKLSPGEHTVTVQVMDEFSNSATISRSFSMP